MAPPVKTRWREADAIALEFRAEAVEVWLAHTEDLMEMLGENTELATKLRGFCGIARSYRDDLENDASKLRESIDKLDKGDE